MPFVDPLEVSAPAAEPGGNSAFVDPIDVGVVQVPDAKPPAPKKSIIQRAKDAISKINVGTGEEALYDSTYDLDATVKGTAFAKGYPNTFFDRNVVPKGYMTPKDIADRDSRQTYISSDYKTPKPTPSRSISDIYTTIGPEKGEGRESPYRPTSIRSGDSFIESGDQGIRSSTPTTLRSDNTTPDTNIVDELRRTADLYAKNGLRSRAASMRMMAGIGRLMENTVGGNASTWIKQIHEKVASEDEHAAQLMAHDPRNGIEYVSQKAVDMALGFLDPKLALMKTPTGFGLVAALEAYGSGANIPETSKSALESAVVAQTFKMLHGQGPVTGAVKMGGVGGAIAASRPGATPSSVLEETATQAAFGAMAGGSLSGAGREVYKAQAPAIGMKRAVENAEKADALSSTYNPNSAKPNPTRDMYKRVIRRELYKVVEEKARESGEGVADAEEMIRTRLRPLDETTRRGDTMIIPETQGAMEFEPESTPEAKPENVSELQVLNIPPKGEVSPERKVSPVAEKPKIDEKSIPYEVQRIEEDGSDPGGTDKPHGLYTSPSDTTSPHEDLGGKRTTYKTNPDSNILHLGEAGTVSSNRGQFVGESAGIAAARKLIGDADVFRMMGLKKDALVVELQSKYPDIDWSRYYDQHEMVEAVGGIEARRRGYDALYLTDKDPKWNEFVALTDNAFESPVVDPVAETNTTTPPEAVTPTGEPAAKQKEPWEMTREEYHKYNSESIISDYENGSVEQRGFGMSESTQPMTEVEKADIRSDIEFSDRNRRSTVERAIMEGKPVPPEVLADYPDLAQKADLPRAETVTPPLEPEMAAEPDMMGGGSERVTPNTASSFADTGGYTRTERAERDTTEPEVEPKPEPLTPEERADYVSSPRFRLELPEIVEFASRAMGGAFPKLKAFLGQGVRGRFRSDTGKIDILRDLSIEELESVIAHEVGHLQDWLTDKDIARGNILGRIASVPGYMKSLLEEYPDAPDKILTKEDRDRFKSEAKSQVESEASDEEIVRTVTREVPKYESVGITPEMILNILRVVTRDPENLLRYLQDVDGSVKKEIAKKAMQDLVDERLQAMAGRRQVGTETITEEIRTKPKINPEDIKARYEQLLRDEIIKRKLYEKESITEELKALSLEYKPFDPSADPGYTKYRFSSVELYADAFSALFNEPEMFERVAPTFKKAYFNYIERKPELKSIYDELQERQLDPESVKTKRREFIRGMAVEGARLRKERADQIKELNSVTRSKLWHVIKKTLGDKNIRATEIMDAAGKVVDNIPDTDRIDWWIETLPYISSEQYAWQRSIEKDIIADLEKHNLDIIDLHEYMFSNRAATERADIASSGGIMGKYARENLDQMRKDLGKETLSDEKFRALESAFNNFRNAYFGSVIQVCKEANFLPKPVMDKMENNPNYATFMDLEHMIDQHMGSGTSAHIYKQHGSLGKVDNVFVQTVLKGSALIRAARHHQVKMAVINSPYIGTVTKAERGPKGVGWSEPSDPNLGLIVVSPEGKPQGYYIDKELADVWKRDPDRASIESRVGLSILGITKSILSGLFIKYNPGWILANPARDIMGTWKKAHDTNGYLAKALWRTYKDAVRAGRGELPERERNLLRKRAIVPDRFYTDEHSISVIEEDFLKSIDDPVAYQNKVTKPINRLMDWLGKYPNPKRFAERQGKKFERWTKFAAEEAINLRDRDKKTQTSDLRKYHTVRTRAGTPDTYARGTLHSWLEFIFPFSNVATQDLRSSVEAYRENKSGYALKTAIANVLPKALFAAATWGMFDFIDDDIKKVAGKAGKYLRRMYNCIPVGLMPNGDAVIITIPQDYAGQTMGALADSILSGDMGGTSLSSLGIVTEGTPYNFNPLLSATKDWAFYWALNIAPKDSFSGRELMSEKVKNAGGMEAAKVLGRETWNDFFGSMIYRFHDDSVTQVNADLKTALGVPPFNAIGRFVRITSQGETERDLDTGKKQRAKEARESIKLGKEKISDINARDKATFSEGANLYTKLVSSGAIDPTETSASAFVKSYNTLGHLKTRNRYIMSIKNARSDGEKAAMLLLWKSELSPSEFNDVTTFLASNKMIGIGALYKAREMGKEKQKEPSVGNFLRKITGGDDSQD